MFIVIGRQQIRKGLLKSEFLSIANSKSLGMSIDEAWKIYKKNK